MSSPESSRVHLLVLGPARSGTTLLASMIGCHSDVRMMSECISHEHRRQIGGLVVGNKLCIPNHITLESSGPILKRPVSPKSNLARLADILRRLAGHSRPAPVSIRKYVEEWDARLVLILRDPDQVVASINRRGGKTLQISRYRWAEAVMTIHRLLETYPDRTHLVLFNDLVHMPEASMKEVCSFVGVSYESRMLEGYKATPQYDRDRIDPSVAARSAPDSEMDQYYPDALKLYRNIMDHRSR